MPLIKVEQLENVINHLSEEFWDEALADQIIWSLSDEEVALKILLAIYEELNGTELREPIFGDTDAV